MMVFSVTFLMAFGSGNMVGRRDHFFCYLGSVMAVAVTSIALAFIPDGKEEPDRKKHDPRYQQVIELAPGLRPVYVMFFRNFYLMSHCFIVIRYRLSFFFV